MVNPRSENTDRSPTILKYSDVVIPLLIMDNDGTMNPESGLKAEPESLSDWPTSEPFRLKLWQHKGSFQAIKDKYFREGILNVVPKPASDSVMQGSLLHDRLTYKFPKGFILVTRSLSAIMNLDFENFMSPGESADDIKLESLVITPDNPSVILVIIEGTNRNDYEDHTLLLAELVSARICKFTNTDYCALRIIVTQSDLETDETFSKALTRIDDDKKFVSRPETSLQMESKYIKIVEATLMAMAVTELVPVLEGRRGKEMWVLSPYQFDLLLESIDTVLERPEQELDVSQDDQMPKVSKLELDVSEVDNVFEMIEQGMERHVIRCPPKSGNTLLMLEVARRWQNLGPTLVCLDGHLRDVIVRKNIFSAVVSPKQLMEAPGYRYVCAESTPLSDVRAYQAKHGHCIRALISIPAEGAQENSQLSSRKSQTEDLPVKSNAKDEQVMAEDLGDKESDLGHAAAILKPSSQGNSQLSSRKSQDEGLLSLKSDAKDQQAMAEGFPHQMMDDRLKKLKKALDIAEHERDKNLQDFTSVSVLHKEDENLRLAAETKLAIETGRNAELTKEITCLKADATAKQSASFQVLDNLTGELHILRQQTTTEPRVFLICPAMTLSADHCNRDRCHIDGDGKLTNTPRPDTPDTRQSGGSPATPDTRQSFTEYLGTCSSSPLPRPPCPAAYYEARAELEVRDPDWWPVLEVGVCRESDRDKRPLLCGDPFLPDPVPGPGAWVVAVRWCHTHDRWCIQTWSWGDLVRCHDAGLALHTPATLHVGVLLDTGTSRVMFIDVGSGSVLASLHVDVSENLWPMFGVTPFGASVNVKLISGRDVAITETKKKWLLRALSEDPK